ncbi:hypothetical protein BDW66DRAFT_24393 [Aspergillus desertorum]
MKQRMIKLVPCHICCEGIAVIVSSLDLPHQVLFRSLSAILSCRCPKYPLHGLLDELKSIQLSMSRSKTRRDELAFWFRGPSDQLPLWCSGFMPFGWLHCTISVSSRLPGLTYISRSLDVPFSLFCWPRCWYTGSLYYNMFPLNPKILFRSISYGIVRRMTISMPSQNTGRMAPKLTRDCW